ncbi:hypothetical protein ACWCO0_04555 [Streptomyces tubercidicus]
MHLSGSRQWPEGRADEWELLRPSLRGSGRRTSALLPGLPAALLAGGPLTHLKRLDRHHHYVSEPLEVAEPLLPRLHEILEDTDVEADAEADVDADAEVELDPGNTPAVDGDDKVIGFVAVGE